jgi:hypothetical protein
VFSSSESSTLHFSELLFGATFQLGSVGIASDVFKLTITKGLSFWLLVSPGILLIDSPSLALVVIISYGDPFNFIR